MNRSMLRNLLTIVVVLTIGCGVTYSSRRYRPENDDEARLFAKAHRDVFPDDIRQDIEKHRPTLVLWSGIIKQAEIGEQRNVLRVLIEHHYWDWIEDYGPQKAIAFLSPRGEGRFECRIPVQASKLNEGIPRLGDMAIVYGTPARSTNDGVLVMDCVTLRSFKKDFYSTEIVEYGRNFSNPRAIVKP
jgi:hypothetical protein